MRAARLLWLQYLLEVPVRRAALAFDHRALRYSKQYEFRCLRPDSPPMLRRAKPQVYDALAGQCTARPVWLLADSPGAR